MRLHCVGKEENTSPDKAKLLINEEISWEEVTVLQNGESNASANDSKLSRVFHQGIFSIMTKTQILSRTARKEVSRLIPPVMSLSLKSARCVFTDPELQNARCVFTDPKVQNAGCVFIDPILL